MHIAILGAAAGGGFPQWNCRCACCEPVRRGEPGWKAATQSSLALSVDRRRWLLVNATPDLRQQLLATPALWPGEGSRAAAIAGVLLTDAQIDHCAGLLLLREGMPLDLYCSPEVHTELTSAFPLLPVLSHWQGGLRVVPVGQEDGDIFHIPFLSGLDFSVVPLRGNAPPYSSRRGAPLAGDNIGLFVVDRNSGKRLFLAPCLGAVDGLAWDHMRQADCLIIDGTFWSNDEMSRVGLPHRLASDMGHLALAGRGGLLEYLAQLPAARRILIHINNTNPVLDPLSAERRQLERCGVEVGFDGMAVEL